MTDAELLSQYARAAGDADDAFAAIVRRHADWVYAVARRRVGGDRQLAEDVTQAVFLVLAQKGKRLPSGTPLAPWLFRVTCFAASRTMRDESRRRRHETEIAATRERSTGESDADELLPALDRAVERLSSGDRLAVLLRFYERLSLAEVGRRLGVSEDAARKRVSRAVDRLRDRLVAAGACPANFAPATLAAVLLQSAAGETGTGVMVATATSLASNSSSHLAKGVTKMILWNQTKAAVAAVATVALVLGGVAAGVHAVAAQQSSSRSVQVNAAAPPRPAVETIETQDMIFAISPDRKELAAFATVTGEWEPLPDASAGAGGARSEIRNTIVLAQGVGAYVDDRRAYGFSGVTGKWDSVAIENPPAPGPGGGCTVAQDVAAYPDGNRVHAYAAPVGKWDTLTLPREGGPPEVVISQEIVRVRHGKTFHTFSAKTGKWTQPPFQIQSP